MKNSHSHSTTCSDPDLCYNGLIKQCVACVNRSSQATGTSTACAPPRLCYDRLIKRCMSCKMMERGAGKATRTAGTCALPHLCYDRLIKQCVDCGKLHRGTEGTTAILRVVSTANQAPHVPAARSTGQGGSEFVFGVYALVGLVLAIAAVLWFVTQKHKRRQKMQQASKEDCEENENRIIPLERQVSKSPNVLQKDGPLRHKCPYSNGTAKTATDGILERNAPCIAVTEATSLSSCDQKCTDTFPLPETELGATVLVTTKTTRVELP
ncbi:hypothetical protein lerEdw1_019540 [Lerista edwardsae]|nr:hypothetical protein lerEdw1_019540 [Lerista edwardsae]